MQFQLIAKDKELDFRSSYKNWPRLMSTPDSCNFWQTFGIFKIDFKRARNWTQNLSNVPQSRDIRVLKLLLIYVSLFNNRSQYIPLPYENPWNFNENYKFLSHISRECLYFDKGFKTKCNRLVSNFSTVSWFLCFFCELQEFLQKMASSRVNSWSVQL